MPDTDEAARKHVKHEPPEEFVDIECHDFRVAPIGVVLPLKVDHAVDEPEEACVRDRDPVCVATEILEHLRWPAKRLFRIHDPGGDAELRKERGEAARVSERCGTRSEGQLALGECAVKRRQILRAEDNRERVHRKQERRLPADPAGTIGREGAARHEAVDVQMLPPTPTLPRASTLHTSESSTRSTRFMA